MGSDIYLALSGAIARLRELDVVANNLANVDTPGFKRDRTAFSAALEASVADLIDRPPAGAPGRVFAGVGEVGADLRPGPILRTGAPLDVAIEGDGFFELQTSHGPRYTRLGSFVVLPTGELGTPDGSPVAGESGTISIGSRPARIEPSGEVIDDSGEVLGRLRVVRFAHPKRLRKEGGTRWIADPGAGPESVPEPRLVPRSLERSNVNPVEELAALVELQRAFEISLRALQTQDETTARLIQEVTR